MELADFEFKKERKLGEFIQDFITLLKIIFSHLTSVLLRMLALPICGMLLLSYYISTQLGTNFSYTTMEENKLIFLFLLAVFFLLVIGMLAFGFTIEYFILLRDQKNTDFGAKDVWHTFKENWSKYFKFLFAALLVAIVIAIPVVVSMGIIIFIPLIGSFGVGIIFSIIGLFFFVAFMLYREGYYDLIDTFTSAFSVLKSKIFEYGIASYIVSFIFQSLLYLITLFPAIIIAILAYVFVGFSTDVFDTFIGKGIISFGGLILTLFSIVYYMLAVLSYGLIYETAIEIRFGENIYAKISNIGKDDDE